MNKYLKHYSKKKQGSASNGLSPYADIRAQQKADQEVKTYIMLAYLLYSGSVVGGVFANFHKDLFNVAITGRGVINVLNPFYEPGPRS